MPNQSGTGCGAMPAAMASCCASLRQRGICVGIDKLFIHGPFATKALKDLKVTAISPARAARAGDPTREHSC